MNRPLQYFVVLCFVLTGCDNNANFRQEVAALQQSLSETNKRIDSLTALTRASASKTELMYHKVFPLTKYQLDSLKKASTFSSSTVQALRPLQQAATPKPAQVVKRAPAPSPSPSYYSGQCQATTKKGSQCSRNARGGSRYCWQHGG